jgi:hypothetical protein
MEQKRIKEKLINLKTAVRTKNWRNALLRGGEAPLFRGQNKENQFVECKI